MNKFTHEHRLNEYLITLKAFIVYRYKYSQENLMYAPIPEYRLNEDFTWMYTGTDWMQIVSIQLKKKKNSLIGISNMEIWVMGGRVE